MNNENDCDLLRLHMKILEDANLTFEQKQAMLDEVRKIMPPEQHRWTLRWIIWFLGAAVISVPLYAIILLLFNWWAMSETAAAVADAAGTAASKGPPVSPLEVPAALLSIASTALGALATFLTQYGKGNQRRSTASPSPEIPPP